MDFGVDMAIRRGPVNRTDGRPVLRPGAIGRAAPTPDKTVACARSNRLCWTVGNKADATDMALDAQPATIKRYDGRLYHTGAAAYVTLADLGNMVKDDEDFVVYDAKTGADVTRSVLKQIIRARHG